MHLRAFAALILSIAACSPGETPKTPTETAPSLGWAIAPEGDLNSFFDCLAAEGATLVSAHRGGPSPGYPENALETFAHLLADIPAVLEIDVATSADGVLYLMHDDMLDRATTGEGAADALSWADIKMLRLRDNDGAETSFAPTRFDAALAWAEGRTVLEIDFKKTTRYADVIAEVNRQHAERRAIYIAYTLAQAKKLHALAPDAMISLSLNSQSELNRAVAGGAPADRLLAFTGTENPRPRLFSLLSDQHVEVIFATLGGADSIDREIARTGDEARYAELAAMGVDIIATDRPRRAHAALAATGKAVEGGECGVEKR